MPPPPVARTFVKEAEAFRTYCQRHFGTQFNYSFESVAILDGVLGECYEAMKGMNENEAWTYLNNMCLAAGGYFGEVFVRNANATWVHEGNPNQLTNWYVTVPNGGPKPTNVAVFGAVYNFLRRGPHETLLAVAAPFLKPNGAWPTAKASTPRRKTASKKTAKVAPRRR